jgi:uncharacterized protein YmfQ (DUF2313 family)
MYELKKLLDEIKSIRNDLVARNYPYQQLTNLIYKWEEYINTPQEERFRQRELEEQKKIDEYVKATKSIDPEIWKDEN